MARVNTMPGAPSELDVLKTQATAEIEKGPSNKYVWYSEPKGKQSNQFPIVPFRADPYDEIYGRKMEKAYIPLTEGSSGWNVPYTENDAAYEMRKRTDDEQARFDAWIMQKYDLSDPAQNLMLQQIVPSLFQRREELIDATQDLVTKYAKARLRGAKSEDDLRLEWLIETKRLGLPDAPIWDPESWFKAVVKKEDPGKPRDAMSKRYQRGWFSILSWLDANTSGWESSDNTADIRGDSTKPYLASGQTVGNVPSVMRVPFYTTEEALAYRAKMDELGKRP